MESGDGVIIAGRYRLVRKLGVGGMGSVWLAHDQSLDTACAVKLVDTEKSVTDEVIVRFEREARAAAQIRGVNVVDVFDHGVWDGVPFIVMEYLAGEDLGARLDRVGRLDLETTYQLVAQVARALVRAHALGIVHRDLKPENIFLVPGDDHEIAKVLDFGIAKHDGYSIVGKTTRTGSFMGTPYYMSPEQARGKPIDFRTDLWALAVIVFQCLTGRPPFESESLGDLLGMIIYDPIPNLLERNPALPVSLGPWWERAVERDRDRRFQSAKDLVDSFATAAGIGPRFSIPTVLARTNALDVEEQHNAEPRLPNFDSWPPRAENSQPTLLEQAQEVRATGTGTGSPVSRTRRSVFPPLSALPRRQRLIALSALGVVVAALVAWSMFGLESGSGPTVTIPAALPPLPPVPSVAAASPPPTVAPVPWPEDGGVDTAPAGESRDARDRGVQHHRLRSRVAPPAQSAVVAPPAPQPVPTRDYGI